MNHVIALYVNPASLFSCRDSEIGDFQIEASTPAQFNLADTVRQISSRSRAQWQHCPVSDRKIGWDKKQAGLNSFILTAKRWIDATRVIGFQVLSTGMNFSVKGGAGATAGLRGRWGILASRGAVRQCSPQARPRGRPDRDHADWTRGRQPGEGPVGLLLILYIMFIHIGHSLTNKFAPSNPHHSILQRIILVRERSGWYHDL